MDTLRLLVPHQQLLHVQLPKLGQREVKGGGDVR